MSRHYIDVLFRIEVELPDAVTSENAADALDRKFTLPPGMGEVKDSERLDAKYAGKCDEETGALIREDGCSGRDAWIVHDPNYNGDEYEDEDQ